jgi:hypothetical protein
MARLALAVFASAGVMLCACVGEQPLTAETEATAREQIERTSISDDCPADWPGPWTACPEADWVQQLAESAGYRVTGETGTALIAAGGGWSFYIWATKGTTRAIRRTAKREKWQVLGTVAAVEVYGDANLWRWWVANGFVVWLQAGPYGDSRPPPLQEMEPLIRASKAVPPP